MNGRVTWKCQHESVWRRQGGISDRGSGNSGHFVSQDRNDATGEEHKKGGETGTENEDPVEEAAEFGVQLPILTCLT